MSQLWKMSKLDILKTCALNVPTGLKQFRLRIGVWLRLQILVLLRSQYQQLLMLLISAMIRAPLQKSFIQVQECHHQIGILTWQTRTFQIVPSQLAPYLRQDARHFYHHQYRWEARLHGMSQLWKMSQLAMLKPCALNVPTGLKQFRLTTGV
jgi:hypothetical protein